MFNIADYSYPVTSAAWAADGQTFVVGSQDIHRSLRVHSIENAEFVYRLATEHDALRVNDCNISGDGSRLAVATNDQRVLIYDFITRRKIAEWPSGHALSCVSLTHDGKMVLVGMNNSKLMLFDALTGEVVQYYVGHKQKEFVIRNGFGGASESFVVSGSEGMLRLMSSDSRWIIDMYCRLAYLHLAQTIRHTSRSRRRDARSAPARHGELCGVAPY